MKKYWLWHNWQFGDRALQAAFVLSVAKSAWWFVIYVINTPPPWLVVPSSLVFHAIIKLISAKYLFFNILLIELNCLCCHNYIIHILYHAQHSKLLYQAYLHYAEDVHFLILFEKLLLKEFYFIIIHPNYLFEIFI